jgi:hypothetical protein
MSLTPTYSNPSHAPYVQQAPRFRAPWAPNVPSTLGMSRSVIHPMVQAGIQAEHDGASDHGTEIKTTPATPIKKEDTSSQGHVSGRDE